MKYYWTLKNGDKISVDDMTEEHLRNVLKLIIKRSKSYKNCDATIWDTF